MILKGSISSHPVLKANVSQQGAVSGDINLPMSRFENDYDLLENKPSIEGVELKGDKSFDELGLVECSALDIINMFN